MSADKDAPKRDAMAISLNMPRILDIKVAAAVIAPERSKADFFLTGLVSMLYMSSKIFNIIAEIWLLRPRLK